LNRSPEHAARNHEVHVAVAVFASLLTIYVATLAPSVTLWDAGEFNAAIGALGIPHPPGTPLYILLAYTGAKALGFLPQALAVNLLSAVATAVACALMAGLMTRWTRNRLAGIASGLTAGTMLAVWQNATETEIYAVSMLLGVLMVVVGDRAGASDSFRLRLLLAYLIGLAIPVQISALVAAPAAIFLASSRTTGGLDARRALASGGVLVAVIGVSLASVPVTILGLVALVVSAARGKLGLSLEALALIVVAVVGMSATLFMLVRAGHDPFINQGNPSTVDAMMDVVWRRQYPLPGMWPRQAPIWIQLLSFVQYADWQVASGLDSAVSASWWRAPWSVGALLLAIAGARWHLHRDARGFRGMLVLLLSTSLGVLAVLNLKAGPSILDRVLPPGVFHEPRERDYFFALAFATIGAWAGTGAVVVSTRYLTARRAVVAGLTIAGLPLLLNWRAANRRTEATLASTLGESLLASAPRNAVLVLAGDNDSYTTWYRQSVLAERRDVVPVTISLLPARWYRAELARRHRLFDSSGVATWRGEEAMLRALVAGAGQEGRPVAAALTVRRDLRSHLGPAWTLGGMAFTADTGSASRDDAVDTAATRVVADLIAARTPRAGRGRDPAGPYVERILRCPLAALQLGTSAAGQPAAALLDSRCNFK
jgi:hypothetical protein